MKYDKDVFRNVTLISQLGLSMIIPVLLCVFIGVMLDKYFQSQTTLAFVFLGIVVGCRNTYMLVMKSVEYKPAHKEKIKLGKDAQVGEDDNEN